MNLILHNKGILLLFILAAIIVGCEGRHHYPQSLTVADSLADHNPDSAINYLNHLATQMSSASEADRMYYQLLCIKAADKAYIPHTSDSLIRPVLEYYEQGGDPQLLPIAYYYGGRVNMDLGDAPQAIEYYQKALDLMGEQSDYLPLKRFVYVQTGELLVKQSLFDEALNAYKSAYDCHKSMNDTVEMIFTLTDIASVYNFKDNRIEALNCLKEAYSLSEITGNDEALPNIANQMSRTYLHLQQPDSAHKYIKLALALPTRTTRDATYNIAVDVYKELGLNDSSMFFCRHLLNSDNIFDVRYSLQQLANYEASNHHVTASMIFFRQWAECNDSVEQLNASRQTAQMNATYNYHLRENENARLRESAQKRKVITSLSLIVCVFMTILVVLLWQYYKKMRYALSLKLEKYKKIVQDYQQKSESKKKLSLSNLINTDLYWQLKKDVSECKHITDGQTKELTLFFSREKPSFRDELSKLTRLNNYQYLICMLVIMGFNASEIARLMCKTPQAINSVRQRLYEKAFGEKGTPQKWDDIIFSLSET